MTNNIQKAFKTKSKLRGMADGGKVKGKGGPTDDKVGPVALSDGEYVLPADTVDIVGRDKLDALRLATHDFVDDGNKPKVSGLRKMANGGIVVEELTDPSSRRAFHQARAAVQAGNQFGANTLLRDVPRPAVTPPPAAAAPAPAPAPAPTPATETPRPQAGATSKLGNAVRAGGALLATGLEAKNVYDAYQSGGVDAAVPEAAMGATRLTSARLGAAAGAALPLPGWGKPVAAAVGGVAGYMAPDAVANSEYMQEKGRESALRGAFSSRLDKDFAPTFDPRANTITTSDGRMFGSGRLDSDPHLQYQGYLSAKTDQAIDSKAPLFNPTAAEMEAIGALRPRAPTAGSTDSAVGAPRPGELPSMSNVPADVRTSSAGMPAVPVQPQSYQSRRLAEMGVPVDQQNLAPVTDDTRRSLLREGGGTPGQYVNLGSYGGDANIYGTASKPGGRIDSFTGVGASSRPGGGPQEDPIMGEIRSALRGLTDGAGNRGGGGGYMPASQAREINKRYDDMLRDGAGRNRVRGLDWSQRHGLDVERARASELDADARNQSALRGQDMSASTAANSANMQARMQALQTLGTMANQRSTQSAQAQAAQLKALQDAQKDVEGRMEDNAKVFESVADTFAEGDKGKASQYRELLATLPPEIHQTAQGLAPEDKRAFYTNIVRQQLGRNDGLVLGRDMGATVQNAAIGGLLGRMTRFGAGAGGKAVDRALGKIPRVGPLLSALRPVENLSRFGTLIGAAGGAYATPEVENLTRWDPVARDPVSGAALPARQDVREAATYGAFDTYLNPFDESVQTASGRRTDRPTPDEEEAARRFRSALRN